MKLCVEQGYYRTPSCNEKLYLHHKGFDSIGGLEEYTDVKVLWLEGNALRRIENLGACTQLRQLYVHQNLISRIEGLESLAQLDSLNISDNYISHISGLDAQAESLTMLQIKNNRLQSIDALEHLLILRNLSSLDLTGNKIDDGEGLLSLLSQLPSLKSLHLSGNPCVRTIPNYRKTVISRLPSLLYLDEKPVFADERRLVTAWARGGVEAERAEKKTMKDEEQEAIRRRLDDFRELTRRAREGQPSATVDEADTDSQPSSDDEDTDVSDVWVGGEAQDNSATRSHSAAQSTSELSEASSQI
jgi:dynein assembly factor 1